MASDQPPVAVDQGADLATDQPPTPAPVAKITRPHVAEKQRAELATRGQQATVHDLATERDKRLKTQQPELATRGQKSLTKKARTGAGKPYVEAVGASVGTMAFRLRWRENGKRQPPIYLSRVSNAVFDLIKKGNYEAFKQQLISNHMPGAVRPGDGAPSRAGGVL